MMSSGSTWRHRRTAPVFERAAGTRLRFEGTVRDRILANQSHWLMTAPDANPAMLEMLRDGDKEPVRDLVPWAGEFAGKYLTSAVQCYRITRDPALRDYIGRFVADLISAQKDDGYLGPFPKAWRLTGKTVNSQSEQTGTWDLWGHYHVMLGLLLWHIEHGDRQALEACRRIADLFHRRFVTGDERPVDTGSQEMNLAPVHVFALLYQRTGHRPYLELAHRFEQDFEVPPAGDYVRTALAGMAFHQTPKPRWESLHPIQGVAELYFATGDEKYRKAFEQIWWSIVEGDRHNTGGFSSGEKATGNPYDQGAIETCCTVAWLAMSVDMLRMTGNPIVADELEMATLNAVLGAQSPSGRWSTYNTPMDGVRIASAHQIVFQARPGSPELNCCSVNAPRGLGLLSEWALMWHDDGLVVNYYGPGVFETIDGGRRVTVSQQTDYPQGGRIRLRVDSSEAGEFPLLLRVPHWAFNAQAFCDGERYEAEPGTYLEFVRDWQHRDGIELCLDMSTRCWVGERECEGTASFYHGPVLLAYDQRFNDVAPRKLPTFDPHSLHLRSGRPDGRPAPWSTWSAEAADGTPVTLCDFASAGATGNLYRSWLPITGALDPVPFSRDNPSRSRPVG